MPRLLVHGFTISLGGNGAWLVSLTMFLVFILSGCQSDLERKVNTWNGRVAEAGSRAPNSDSGGPEPGSGNDVQLTAQLGGIVYLDTGRIVHVATTLYNPTSDTLRFISMSCSYEDMFLVGENDGYVIRSRYDCFKNAPSVVIIPPKSHLDQFIMIAAVDKSTRIHTGRLKIGMMWMDPVEHRDIISAYQHRKELARVIWSNELDLDRLYRRSYK